jgi:hypothetical protein
MPKPAEVSIFARALDWLKARLERNEELDTLTGADIDFLAADIGISPAQFRDIAPMVIDHGWQMEEMMRARGLDPNRVRLILGPLFRDMEVLCTQCHSAGRCQRELKHGTAAANMHTFCVNAATIDSLVAQIG